MANNEFGLASDCDFNLARFSVESLDELLSETKKLNQTVQLKEEKIKTLENKYVCAFPCLSLYLSSEIVWSI